MTSATNHRLVLRVTKPTLFKRRLAPDAALAANEKVMKEPCRIYVSSYAYSIPGEDLQNHYKVCFTAPFMGSSVWYVDRNASLVEQEGAPPPPPPKPSTPKGTHINEAGLELIKSFEGLRLEAYRCPAGVPTIGYGTTTGVKMGTRITKAEAEALLRRDLEKFEAAVRSLVKVPLTDNQFSALVSFTYNLGAGALQHSTLLKLVNQGNFAAAAREFLKWNRAGGRVLPGLTRRRQAEEALFIRK